MLIDCVHSYRANTKSFRYFSSMKKTKAVIMVSPDYFRVEYGINIHMRNAQGELNRIDPILAKAQWMQLKSTFEQLGLKVHVIEPDPELPDMVFTANPSFVFWNATENKPTAVLSKMHSSKRQKEVNYLEKWYQEHGYEVVNISGQYSFEGNGDALLDLSKPVIWGGYGFRTEKNAYEELASLTGLDILLLKLVDERFYHLDTCFALLDPQSVAVVPEAFDKNSLALIEENFTNVLKIPLVEAVQCFAGNCFCPNAKDVVLHNGSETFKSILRDFQFNPIEVDTGEYLKSGGSVFCMKMFVY